MRQRIPNNFKLNSILTSNQNLQTLEFESRDSMLSIEFLSENIAKVVHSPHIFKGNEVNDIEDGSLLDPASKLNYQKRELVVDLTGSVIRAHPLVNDKDSQRLVVEINYENDFTLSWSAVSSSQVHPDPFLQDLPWRAYEFDEEKGCHHYFKHEGQKYYGLGEKTGPALCLNERSFRIATSDSMGYNSEKTDPLYKHIPWYVGLTKDNCAYGVFYNTSTLGQIDFACEIDALWGSFTSFKSEGGMPLEMYIIYGPSVAEVLENFSLLVGRPALIPKYAYGYLASAMGYAEAENAQELLEQFPQKLKMHSIPCDVLHLSSGYTVDCETKQRNVFTWNRKRFPNPSTLFQTLLDNGIRTVANVKPWLLCEHPQYFEMDKARGLLFDPASKRSSLSRLWSAGAGESGQGSYIDILGDTGRDFWKKGVDGLLNVGIDGIWNDNNEFSSISDDNWRIGNWDGKRETKPLAIRHFGRARLTNVMAEASYEAMIDHNPEKRPFLISRSASIGTHRYCSSWSGDNYTSWHTLKHNIPIGLHAGLSLLPNYGHDIGGFAGPIPSPELFVRWVQCGIYLPRFCIHSWKEQIITEPWMFPKMLPHIHSAIQFRYKLIPYIYDLGVKASLKGHPIIRPIFYHFQDDQKTHDQAFEFFLGPHMLVYPVYLEKKESRQAYLPKLGRYYDIFHRVWYSGGGEVTLPVPLSQPCGLLAISGAAIPINPEPGRNSFFDKAREILVFPDPDTPGSSSNEFYDDDGISLSTKFFLLKLEMQWTCDLIQFEIVILKSDFKPAYSKIQLIVPFSDMRNVELNGQLVESESLPINVFVPNKEDEAPLAFDIWISRRNFV